jgi:hypothetical protein
LLLNTSNLENRITFPYAFVQITEIASRFDIEVIRKDLYGIDEGNWQEILSQLLQTNKIDLVGITLRNVDTHVFGDYFPLNDVSKEKGFKNSEKNGIDKKYYPINDTKNLINVLRKTTSLPLVVGGFGFSIIPEILMNELKPDFGVFGGPDDFFEKIEQVLNRENLASVTNILYFENNVLKQGPRHFFPPAVNKEYSESIISEIKDMKRKFGDKMVDDIAVEISRGCAYECNFCSEPPVKGNFVQFRNLKSLEEDIELLGKHNFNKLFLVCCEMNSVNNEYILSFAKLIQQINEKLNQASKITWEATYLMKFDPSELKSLWDGGWRGGWYDVISLEDENLKKIRAPYDSKTILSYLENSKELLEQQLRETDHRKNSIEERLYHYQINNKITYNPISFFLGNVYTTIETVKKTIEIFDETKLNEYFDYCNMVRPTRILSHQQPNSSTLKVTQSILNNGVFTTFDEKLPSFAYPPILMEHFRTIKEIEIFYQTISESYLSQHYLYSRNWKVFLKENLTPKLLLDLLDEECFVNVSVGDFSNIPEVQELFRNFNESLSIKYLTDEFFSEDSSNIFPDLFISKLITQIFSSSKINEMMQPILKNFNLGNNTKNLLEMSSYKITILFFEQFKDKNDFFNAIKEFLNAIKHSTKNIAEIFFKFLIYSKNINLDANYRIFFI